MSKLFLEQPKIKHIYQILGNRANYQGLVLVDLFKVKTLAHCTKHYVKKSIKALIAHHYLKAYKHHKNIYLIVKLNQEYKQAEHIMSPHAILHMKRYYKRKIVFLRNNNEYLRATNRHWVKIVKQCNKDNASALKEIKRNNRNANVNSIKAPSIKKQQQQQEKIKEKYQQKRPQSEPTIYTSKNNSLVKRAIQKKPDEALKFHNSNDKLESLNDLVKQSNSKIAKQSTHTKQANVINNNEQEFSDTQSLTSNALQTSKNIKPANSSSTVSLEKQNTPNQSKKSDISNHKDNQMFTL